MRGSGRNLSEAMEEPIEGSGGLAGLVSLCHFDSVDRLLALVISEP